MPLERFHLAHQETPIGTMLLVIDDEQRLRMLDWADHRARMTVLLGRY